MDWFNTLNGFWILAIFCALFMAIMMFGCMRFGSGHGGRSCHGREPARDSPWRIDISDDSSKLE